MKLSRRLLALAAVFASLQLVSAGDITGKIDLKGTPPPEKEFPLDPNCGKLHAGKPAPTTRFYAVNKSGGLADVFIYVKDGLTGKAIPAPAGKSPLLDQEGCEYIPYVIGVQANQPLLVRNSDPVLHNVHPMPAVAGNSEKNLAHLPKSKDLSFVFPKQEILVKFKCDVHQWMFAWVGVVDHPYFAVSDKDGNFKISGLPAGEYTIEAVHRKAGKQTAKVKVDESGAVPANFTFEVPK
jgi:hypothetical protein